MSEVFISYAWGGESEAIANTLEKTFQEKGIKLVRDKTDLGYKGLIKEFMQQLGQGKCVVAIVSDKYLKSKNCMYELLEISRNGEFYDHIFPIVFKDAHIYDGLERLNYIRYWENKIRELEEGMKSVGLANLQGFTDEINLYTEIRNKIAGLVDTLQNMNTLTAQMHQDSGFEEVVEAIEKRLTDEKEDKSLVEKVANLDTKDNNIVVSKPKEEGLLIEERNMDYQELKNLLSVQKWEEADQKTWSLMFQLAGHPDQESLSEAEMRNLQ